MLTNGLGISKNPLNDISKVYMESVAAKPDFLDLDKDGNKKEPMKKAAKEKKVEPPKEKLKTDRDMFNVPKDEQKAAKERLLAKARAKRAKKMSEGLDPVGQEDADIDNDGDTDKTDKYLHNRRKAIGKAIKKKKGIKEQEEKIDGGNLGKLSKKATKRYDADNDGDVDKDDAKETGMGEFVPTPDGKKKLKTKVQKEGFSNWRTDLIEVVDSEDDEAEIKEKKVKNKIKINPELGEAIEQIGGTIIEMVEIDEIDCIAEEVFQELISEGWDAGDVFDAIEYSLIEAKVTYGHDTPTKRDEMMKKAKGRLKYLGRKVKEKVGSAKKKAGMASAQTQVAAYNKAREAAQTAGDKARRAKKSVEDAPKKAKKGVKGLLRRAAQKVVDRMSEEVEQVDEKLNMKKEKMGDVIKDFYKSDAPQFKGKSKEKRREMAIAAKLTAERGGKKLGEENIEEGLPLALGAGAAAIGGAAYLINKAKKASETHSDKAVGKPTVQGVSSGMRNRNAALDKLRGKMRNEEATDAMRDRRQERGGVDGNKRYDRKSPFVTNTKKHGVPGAKTPAQVEMEKKYGKGATAMDVVKADLRAKYGKGAVMDTKNTKKKKK